MIICYSYNGILPDYTLYTIHQSRLFSKDAIYLITNDKDSPILDKIRKYNIIIIDYESVKSVRFFDIINSIGGYPIVKELKYCGRENLFLFSLERFFLLYNLMDMYNMTDILFLELDNTIYDNPDNWLDKFKTHELSYMCVNVNKASTGLMYVKSKGFLYKLLESIISTITVEKCSEMKCTYIFAEQNKDMVEYLPCHYEDSNYLKYGSVFDGASIGIYLFGYDPIHTGNKIVTNIHNIWGKRNYIKELFKWERDEKNRLIPFILDKNGWVRINNLHIHSKQLKKALSIQIND